MRRTQVSRLGPSASTALVVALLCSVAPAPVPAGVPLLTAGSG
ncbi:hypothetical protein ACGFZP_28775 [Kitasatospora sp. NPDC048239]